MKEIADHLSIHEIEKKLQTQWIGSRILIEDEMASTNDRAMAMGKEGAPAGTVLLAESQIRGKGRLGRTWVSPPGVNLYVSILFRPEFSPSQAPMMTLMAAVAVVEAIRSVTGLGARIKWPNDILIRNKKVSGILTEMNAEQDRIHHLVVGIGINVNMDLKTLPPDIERKAASLSNETGHRLDRIQLLCCLLESLEAGYATFMTGGAGGIMDRWNRYSTLHDQKVRVSTSHGAIEGWVQGLTAEGALRLRKDDGTMQTVFSGDVEVIEA